jgi:hypothetical protein
MMPHALWCSASVAALARLATSMHELLRNAALIASLTHDSMVL